MRKRIKSTKEGHSIRRKRPNEQKLTRHTIKSSGDFTYDLIAALNFPQWLSENSLVKFFVRDFPRPNLVIQTIDKHKRNLSQFRTQGLKSMLNKRLLRSKAIQGKIQYFIKSVILCINKELFLVESSTDKDEGKRWGCS
jgi:hypothetical protein